MDRVTFDELLHLAQQLTYDEQKALIARLELGMLQREAKDRSLTEEDFSRTLGLLVFDVGPWPPELTLRREDEYGDAGRLGRLHENSIDP